MALKNPTELVNALAKKINSSWAEHAATAIGAADPGNLPFRFPLGEPARPDLEKNWEKYRAAASEWLRWAPQHEVSLETSNRLVFGSNQEIPTHATVSSLDIAMSLLTPETTRRHDRGKARSLLLNTTDLGLDHLVIIQAVRLVDTWSDIDLDLAIQAARWFRTNDASGLTPRQVPLPGIHAKWLQSHKQVVTLLTGRNLNLQSHPGRVHFTYLDPKHLASGGRQHDSVTVNDNMIPAYRPQVVIISENKDTAINFPPVPGGVAVEGEGYGPATHAAIPWLAGAPVIIYWGDLDQDGFQILHQFRTAGMSARSILMDLETFNKYAEFGTMTDSRGKIITPHRKDLPTLTPSESEVYERITNPKWAGPRRVEQERIPLFVAQNSVLATIK